MVSKKDINEMEYLTSHFWPARVTERFKGWIISWDSGITWRANSVLPVEQIEDMEIEKAIEYVIAFYAERNTPAAFKMTEASLPEDLDETLDDIGFRKFMVTHVKTMPCVQLSCIYPKVPVDILKVNDISIDMLMIESGYQQKAIETRKNIINRIAGEKGIARVMIDGRLAGLGLGVVQDKLLGLFSIRTLPEYRRRGVAASVSCALGMWGEDLGATKVFLQVEAKNTPAIDLYDSMGFQTDYSYWYRVLDLPKSQVTL